MKFRHILSFELSYQLRQLWPWLFFIILLALSFLMTRDGSLSEVLYADFFLNSPFAIAKTTVFGSLIWLVMAAAIAGDSAARDVALRMYPLCYSVPVSKSQYLGGKFAAAFLINAFILLAVQAGILLGVYLPGVDAALIGPFRPSAFLSAYTIIALPNALTATSIQFALAMKSGRAMTAYVGSFLLVFMGFFVGAMLLFKSRLGTLLDPIGIRFVVEDLSHLWTTHEMSWRLMELEGTLLWNRIFWLAVSVIVISISYASFKFHHRTQTVWWRRRDARAPTPSTFAATVRAMPPLTVPPRPGGFSFHIRQTFSIAWSSFRWIATGLAGQAFLVAIPLLTIIVVLDQTHSNGVPLLPRTTLVIAELTASLSDELSRWVIVPFLIVFFAGELMWRERDAGVSEITDTMPGSDWPQLLGKFIALLLLLLIFMIMLTLSGIVAQAVQGYEEFEVWLYIKTMIGLQLTDYILFAVLALSLHVVVNHKYVAHLIAVVAYVFISLASLFGVEHNLLIFAAAPAWSYSEMRGFAGSLEPWLWFKAYWAGWALLLFIVARLFWVRNLEEGFRMRMQIARLRFTDSIAMMTLITAGVTLGIGAFIFYNTNILNDYLSMSDVKERAANYERRYARYSNAPQPGITKSKLHIEIYPDQRKADIRGTYYLVNATEVDIDTIHVATTPEAGTKDLAVSVKTKVVPNDEPLHHRMFVLQESLLPGDSMELHFSLEIESHGFGENGAALSVVPNGTELSSALFPSIGYKSSRELITANDRREHRLRPRPLFPSLYDTASRKSEGGATHFEAVIGTEKRQVAVAPGRLLNVWMENERKYFHYSTEGSPGIGSTYDVVSARYHIHEETWKPPPGFSESQPVKIRVFHHPNHTHHLDRMLTSIRASLEYYTTNFGPYERNYLTVVEHAGNGTGMHADPGMITHPEGFTFWNPHNDPHSHDHPNAIVAHEMAHQWTVPYAAVEGAPVLSESVAWYYGMKLVEHSRGHLHLKQLLGYMHHPHPYPAIRRGEPLLRGLDPYLSYRRGPFALYTMSEYIGEDRLNTALRLLLEKHRGHGAPLATTLDLYSELETVTPDSLQPLLHDLFKVNAYWELKINNAIAVPASLSNVWNVKLDIDARKMVYDSAGVHSEVPMNDWIEVGVFSSDGASELHLQKHRLTSGKQTLSIPVEQKPGRAVIDPKQLMIDLNFEDNARAVKGSGIDAGE